MKKVFAVLVVVLAAVMFTACGGKTEFSLDDANAQLRLLTVESYGLGYFGVNDSMPSWKENKDKLVAIALTVPEGYVLSVVGNTCAVGSDAANQRLGLQRANEIKKFLQGKGVAADRLLALSNGEKSLSQSHAANSPKQRRTYFVVVPLSDAGAALEKKAGTVSNLPTM
jgi:outer membrane protein OmpA-like peptidoglycan-associated protein